MAHPARQHPGTGVTPWVVVSGNHVSSELFIGEAFTSQADLIFPVLRQQAPGGGFFPITSANVIAKKIFVKLGDSAYAEVVVTTNGVEEKDIVDTETATTVPIQNLDIEALVVADDVDASVRIRTATQKPMNIVGAEWLVEVGESGTRGQS